MRKATAVLFCALLFASTRCGGGGSGPGPDSWADLANEATDTLAATATLGPEGGAMDLPGGGTLQIPANALTEAVEITIERLEVPDSTPFVPRGRFYSFQPSGLLFKVPATLTLMVNPINPIDGLSVAWREAGGDWLSLPGEPNVIAETIQLEIAGFSEGGPAEFPLEVCCSLAVQGGTMVKLLTESECQDWAATTPDSTVTSSHDVSECSVCCADDKAVHPVSECQTPYDFLEGCEVVCCQTGEAVTLLSRMDCTGIARDASLCDVICCDTYSFLDMTRWECQTADGQPSEGAQDCEEVCCLSDGHTSLSLGGACPGELLPVSECDTVCCNSDGHYSKMSMVLCAQSGGGEASGASDCEPACCFKNGQENAVVPRGECTGSGAATLATEQCDMLCCQLSNGTYEWATLFFCNASAGSAASDLSLCEPLCCLTSEFGAIVKATGDCNIEVGTPVDGALICGNQCCLQPENTCAQAVCTEDGCGVGARDGNECATSDECPDGQECSTDCACVEGLRRP